MKHKPFTARSRDLMRLAAVVLLVAACTAGQPPPESPRSATTPTPTPELHAQEAAMRRLEELTDPRCLGGPAGWHGRLGVTSETDAQIEEAGITEGWLDEGMWVGSLESLADELGAEIAEGSGSGDWLVVMHPEWPYAQHVGHFQTPRGVDVWQLMEQTRVCGDPAWPMWEHISPPPTAQPSAN